MQKFTIAIHGGAGTILKSAMTSELEEKYVSGLHESLDKGFDVLASGGSALRAVMAAVIALEDNILFNAGKGSVFNSEGQHEMDAAIMDGSNLMAGAVSAVRNIRNPIELAEKVMLNSKHVFLSGLGANEFAIQQGVKFEPDEYFFSQSRFDQWRRSQQRDDVILDHTPLDNKVEQGDGKKFGTVGAVACDSHGNIAAATSTGGMTNKKFGRVGDSPLIGCGTYANNKTCAVSCTGHGEPFIRAVTAYDVSCLMEYKGLSLQEAMQKVVFEKLISLQGEGGMIGVDASGNAAMMFNSEGMYRGMKNNAGEFEIAIYK
jgi:beta-aspartyl-peptidase (threonine type)